MTHHRRYQLACGAAAFVLGLVGTLCARHGLWWETSMFAFVALFLVEASLREGRAHKTAVRRSHGLARPDRPTNPNEPATGPCCPVAARFGDGSHTTHCTRKDHAA